MIRRFPLLLLFILAGLLAVPAASSAAEIVAGSVHDDSGDGSDPQVDVRRAVLLYGTSGFARGAVVLGQPPASAFGGLEFLVGNWSTKDGVCHRAADVTVFPPTPESNFWLAMLTVGDSSERAYGPASSSSSTVIFEINNAEKAAGQRWNCAWVNTFNSQQEGFDTTDSTQPLSLTPEEAAQPDASPKCEVLGERVRRGKKVRMRCSNVDGRLTIRVYLEKKRTNKLLRTSVVTVRGDRVDVSTKGLSRGRHGFYAWRGDNVVGHGYLNVR